MKPHAKIDSTLTGEIIRLVCEVWNIDRATLCGKGRRRPLPWARAQLCHYLRRYAGHDTVSCAAILHMSGEGVMGYAARYEKNRSIYAIFVRKDKEIGDRLKNRKP